MEGLKLMIAKIRSFSHFLRILRISWPKTVDFDHKLRISIENRGLQGFQVYVKRKTKFA